MTRPKQAILSRNLIRDQALALVDEGGLDALTMRRLATRLGVQAASLYTHFPNKDAVLDAIANRLARSINASNFGESWQEGLRTWATSFYDVIHWHPNAAPIVTSGNGRRTQYLAVAELVHTGLVSHGWPPRHALMVAASINYIVMGAATTHFASGFSEDESVYDERFPNLRQAHLLPRVAETIDRDSFMLGLESTIRGLEPVHAAVAEPVAADSKGAD